MTNAEWVQETLRELQEAWKVQMAMLAWEGLLDEDSSRHSLIIDNDSALTEEGRPRRKDEGVSADGNVDGESGDLEKKPLSWVEMSRWEGDCLYLNLVADGEHISDTLPPSIRRRPTFIPRLRFAKRLAGPVVSTSDILGRADALLRLDESMRMVCQSLGRLSDMGRSGMRDTEEATWRPTRLNWGKQI